MKLPVPVSSEPLKLLSVVIPARDEAGCIAATVEHLHVELRLKAIPHEILVVNDECTDSTWANLQELSTRIPGESKLKIEEMGSRYLFIALYY
jgi:dolichol-phosphate mannosyltransferase